MSVISALLPKAAREAGTYFSTGLSIPEKACGTMEVMLSLSGNDLKDPEVSIVFGIEVFKSGEWKEDAGAVFTGSPDNSEQPGFFVNVSDYAGKTIRARFTAGKRVSSMSMTAEY
ncbi:MAG: hypothetical protein LLG06_10895 [Desulfobacteraceae bacterium]|nr:hypothetical protein [Desulfobacteraceae bacterium]